MKENLTKENFWNDIGDKYPKAMAYFNTWIDNYKVEVEWNDLFVEELFDPVKYHDLPLAMQFGIFLEFYYDYIKAQKIGIFRVLLDTQDFRDCVIVHISNVFRKIDGELNKSQLVKVTPEELDSIRPSVYKYLLP